MAVVSCIKANSSLQNAQYDGVSGMGADWAALFSLKAQTVIDFTVQTGHGVQKRNGQAETCHSYSSGGGSLQYEVKPSSGGTYTPLGTAVGTAWVWWLVISNATEIVYYMKLDADAGWTTVSTTGVRYELEYVRLFASVLSGGPGVGLVSKCMVKRGVYTAAGVLPETQKLGIASDAADTILYLPNTSAAAIDTNQASPSGGSATYKMSAGSHTGTPVDVPGDSPLFLGDARRNSFFGVSP